MAPLLNDKLHKTESESIVGADVTTVTGQSTSSLLYSRYGWITRTVHVWVDMLMGIFPGASIGGPRRSRNVVKKIEKTSFQNLPLYVNPRFDREMATK